MCKSMNYVSFIICHTLSIPFLRSKCERILGKTKPVSKSRALERSDNENKTTLTPSTAADESEIVEFGHLILYHRRGVSHLSTKVFVVARSHGH